MLSPRSSLRTGILCAIVAMLAGVVFLILPYTSAPFGRALTDLSYDVPFLFRKNIPVADVVIVYMDVASEERLNQNRGSRWDRGLHADLLNVLARAGSRAVAFDITFYQEGTNPVANARLVDAARRHGRVAVGALIGPAFYDDGTMVGKTLWKPFQSLASVAAWGMAEEADETGAIREHVRRREFEVPSLAWRVFELTRDKPSGDPFASRWLNYYGENGFIPHVSYADVLATNFDVAAVFSNKVVFVGSWWVAGFSGGKGTDDYRTPHTLRTGRRMAGVEVCATSYLNLARGDWLRRLSPVAESALIGLFGALAGLLLARVQPMTGAGLAAAGIAATTLGGLMLPWQTGVWFPWLIVGVVQIPAALGVSILQHTRHLQRDKRALEQTLAMAHAGSSPDDVGNEPARGRSAPGAVGSAAEAHATPKEGWSPVGIGSSARPSGPSAAVGDLVKASAANAGGQPSVPGHELLRKIGRGAYGEVWLGRDVIGSYHAIKLVFRNAFKEAEPYEREFHGLRRFTPISRQNPGFVHILQVGRNDEEGYLYYVMELGDDIQHGQSIQPATYAARTLASDIRNGRRLPLEVCLDVGIHLANALEFLHGNQLIHRDVKPSNVIFVNGVAKFADIGLVTEIASEGHDVSYLGTKGYIAPEGPGSAAADVYSLGKVIYQTGFGMEVSRFPELPTSVVMDPDETALFGLNRVVMKACDSRIENRYPTAAALAQALAELKAQLRPRPL